MSITPNTEPELAPYNAIIDRQPRLLTRRGAEQIWWDLRYRERTWAPEQADLAAHLHDALYTIGHMRSRIDALTEAIR